VVSLEGLALETVRPLRRLEYERLVETGVFEDERLELLQGVLVSMSPQGAPHAAVIWRLYRLLSQALGARAEVRAQSQLALSEDSEPEPDVFAAEPGEYTREHPSKALLVVEVSDSTLRKDRGIKAKAYARAGIPEYWIVNLADGVVEVHTAPAQGRYGSVAPRGRTESITLIEFPDVALRVSDVIPEI
jgi:Uma2 family endonuclease